MKREAAIMAASLFCGMLLPNEGLPPILFSTEDDPREGGSASEARDLYQLPP
jgi:hypothetical protein